MTGKAHRREVRCAKCGFWWHHPREPLHFASWDEWAEEHQEKETLSCPSCGERTEVSEGTVRFAKVSDETSAPPGVSKETPGFTKVSDETSAPPGVSKKTPGFTEVKQPEKGKPAKRKG